MQLDDLGSYVQKMINQILYKDIQQIRQQIQTILSCLIDDTQLLLIIINYFAQSTQLNGEIIIQYISKIFENIIFTSQCTNIAVNVQNKVNRLGQILSNVNSYQDIYQHQLFFNLQQQVYGKQEDKQGKQKLILFVNGLLESGYKTTYMCCVRNSYLKTNIVKSYKLLYSFINYFKLQQRQKFHTRWLNMNGFIEMKAIEQGYNAFKNQLVNENQVEADQNNYLHARAVIQIYDEYVNDKYTCAKFRALNVLQYIIQQTEEQFTREFQISSQNDVQDFVKFIKQSQIQSLNQLQMAIQISKHLDHSDIDLKFNYIFKLQDITEDIARELFNGERLQRIQAHNNLVIIRNVNTNNLFVKEITKDTDNIEIEKFLEQFINNQVYDIFLKGGFYQNISKIKIKYLGYVKNQQTQNITLTLNYPLELQSLYLYKVQLTNLFECENLENIYTEGFEYNEQSFTQKLCNVKRFCSLLDTYVLNMTQKSISTLINKLFSHNKLRYVHIQGEKSFAGNLLLNMNLQNLRYFYYSTKDKDSNVKVDLQRCYPCLLQILQKKSHDEATKNQQTISIPLIGTEKLIQKFAQQLV